ncbi:MAG: hypothetical protein LBP70_00125 [Mycoplasmataceae bacterium]|jgi:hypothetical protein|nr:hypothetical protein [Mycoplasmataceae bacterium]
MWIVILVIVIVTIIVISSVIFGVKKYKRHEKLLHSNKTLEEKYQNLRLKIQIIPEKNHEVNLHEIVKFKEDWEYIQKCVKNYSRHLANQNGMGKCCYCNKVYRIGLIECHEEWDWDVDTHKQLLKRVVPVCPFCHNVVHFGQGDEGFRRLAYSWLKYIDKFNDEQSEAYRNYIYNIQRTLYDPIKFEFDETSINRIKAWASKYERI